MSAVLNFDQRQSLSESPGSLNFAEIEAALYVVRANFRLINRLVSEPRDPMTGEVISNMMDGYRFLNEICQKRVELFAMGHSALILEFNTLVLCGSNKNLRSDNSSHIRATEQKFYAPDHHVGFSRFIEWVRCHEDDDVYRRAAGVLLQVLEQPQLFIEGNHRTGALLADYVLLYAGYPPFIITEHNAVAYLDLAALIKRNSNRIYWRIWQKRILLNELADLMRQSEQPDFLLS